MGHRFGATLVALLFAGCAQQDLPPPAPERICGGADFCWEHPLPQGNPLRAVWGASPGEAWAGGEGGTFLHFDGLHWRRETAAVSGGITSISGRSSNDVWVASEGGLLRFDGRAWNPGGWSGAAISGIRVEADGTALASAAGELVAWDGSSWAPFSPAPPSNQVGAFARSGDELWLGTPSGVRHFSQGWTSIAGVNGVSGLAPVTNGVVGTSGAQLLRFENEAWKALGTASEGSLEAPTPLSDGLVWMVQWDAAHAHSTLAQWTEGRISPLDSPIADPVAISARGMNDVWVAGARGQLGHFDGLRWDASPAPVTGDVEELFAAADEDVWAAGDGLAHWNGRTWEAVADGHGTRLRAMSATSAMDVWAVGAGGVALHFGGHAWSAFPAAPGLDFDDVSSLGGGIAWAVAGGHALRFDGSAWTIDDPAGSPALSSIGASDELVIAATADGRAFRKTAAGWDELHTAGFTGIRHVVIRGPAEALAVTDAGLALYDGTRLALWAPSAAPLCGRPVNAGDDVLVLGCGAGAPLWRWDGAGWSQLDTGVARTVHALTRTTSGDLWVGGEGGALLRRIGR